MSVRDIGTFIDGIFCPEKFERISKDMEIMPNRPLDEQEIRYQISQIKELPSLTRSMQRIIEIIHSEVESASELESIIGYDQALAAKILRIANSTYYGCRGNVKNLAKSIVVIGFNQVKSICLCTLLMNMLSDGATIDPEQRERLWKHAFATSRIAAEMSRKRPWVSRDEAAAMGLLHDIGYVVMAAHFSERFKSIMDAAEKRKSPPWCVEVTAGISHTQLGRYVAVRWAFPESFRAVIEFHHSPDKSRAFAAETKLIFLANILSNSVGYPELLQDEATLSCCRELYISEEEWQEYQDGLELVWPEVDQLWNLLR